MPTIKLGKYLKNLYVAKIMNTPEITTKLIYPLAIWKCIAYKWANNVWQRELHSRQLDFDYLAGSCGMERMERRLWSVCQKQFYIV